MPHLGHSPTPAELAQLVGNAPFDFGHNAFVFATTTEPLTRLQHILVSE